MRDGIAANPLDTNLGDSERLTLCALFAGPQDSTNATVQLQGPFLVDKLSPPPAHRNVIMIAAGTGINPSTWEEGW